MTFCHSERTLILSFRTNPHSVIQNDPHSVILNEVKNLYHKDPSLPLRMTKMTEKFRMTKEEYESTTYL